jgi:hypothetical protein
MRATYSHLAAFLLLGAATAACAEEGDAGHYAPGSFAFFADVLPGDPAVGVFNYFRDAVLSPKTGVQAPMTSNQ